ncbi:hypothetical protein FRACYDRAFT_236711 [Fragilariopsis cylindrus CCMP1102]|uniref:Sulfotransferase domain-containing protein n=1 Tax=Fragilariopsis cylindrus CCMP1102 TaxID=635003 RepID=A0A1E7FJT1_9STRA|nr:hypothetical protein FRACYDRAFT_236711 [Fragilariopsis cylindrus CCMP1102]|eukprot:OEU18432.1 hypothetical protein FRACYDRAFT_236711 [Fragilariopsis cylindrus CCMP1102]
MKKSRNNNNNEQPTTITITTNEETRQKEQQQQQQKQSLHLIFTVTAGRSGTTLLTRLLELIPVVVAKHEPKPSFVNVMRKVQNNATTTVDADAQTTSKSDISESESDTTDESIATTFLKEKKIPLILQQTNAAAAAAAAAQQQQQQQQQQRFIPNMNSNKSTAVAAASPSTQLPSTTTTTMSRNRITHYVETSHLFCKGFIEPMKKILLESSKTSTNSSSLFSSSCGDGGNHHHHHHHDHHHSSCCCCYGYKLQKTFSLIILRRHPSLIAYSLLQRNAIPGRSRWGKKYLLHPNDWNVLGNNNEHNDNDGKNGNNDRRRLRWISILSSWSDYQLCYWYALEIERRQIQYTKMACDDGDWKCCTITIDELTNFDKFCTMCIALGIELPISSASSSLVQVTEGGQEEDSSSSFRDQFERIAKQKHNLNNPTTCNDKQCNSNDNGVEQHEKGKKKSASASASASASRLLVIKQQYEKEEKQIWEWIRINSSPDIVSDLVDYQLPSPL